MSLIYDALRSDQGAAQPHAAAQAPTWWARQSSRRRGAALLAAGALLATPLAFVAATGSTGAAPIDVQRDALEQVARPLDAPGDGLTLVNLLDDGTMDETGLIDASVTVRSGAVPTSVVASTAVLPEVIVPEPAPATSTNAALTGVAGAPTPLAASDAPTMHAEPVVAAVERSAAPLPAPAPPQAMATMSAPAGAASIRVERRDANTPAGPLDDAAVLRATQAVEAAVAANDLPAAHAALAHLEGVLPASSLTLLRMRAWVAHGSHDMAAAESLYRQIIERVPDDMNAGVNIALLDARRGDVGDARDRLTRLSARHLRSPQVARALAELDTLTQ